MLSVQTRDFVDLAARSHDLGCRVPVGIALLPGNFATAANPGEFCFHAATPHIRSAWQTVGLHDEGPLGTSPKSMTGDEQVPLVAFFGAGLLSGPEWGLTVALGMVSRVLALHPACASPWEVRFDAVVERPGTHGCTCIEYQGDAFGIVALTSDVRRIWADIPTDGPIPSSRAPGTSVEHADSEVRMALGSVKSETRRIG
jgi:hypothetical protein